MCKILLQVKSFMTGRAFCLWFKEVAVKNPSVGKFTVKPPCPKTQVGNLTLCITEYVVGLNGLQTAYGTLTHHWKE